MAEPSALKDSGAESLDRRWAGTAVRRIRDTGSNLTTPAVSLLKSAHPEDIETSM